VSGHPGHNAGGLENSRWSDGSQDSATCPGILPSVIALWRIPGSAFCQSPRSPSAGRAGACCRRFRPPRLPQHLADPATAGEPDDRVVLGAKTGSLSLRPPPARRGARSGSKWRSAVWRTTFRRCNRSRKAELVLRLQRRDAVGMRRHAAANVQGRSVAGQIDTTQEPREAIRTRPARPRSRGTCLADFCGYAAQARQNDQA
jgi:hypothetical protein